MNEDKKKFLTEALGAEFVNELESNTDKAKVVLDALGVESKEVKQEDVAPEQPAQIAQDDITKAVVETIGLPQLSETLERMQKALDVLLADKEEKDKILAALQKTDDEKIAEKVQTTPAQMFFWQKSQSQDDGNVLDPEKDKELLASKPNSDYAWLRTALG